MKGDEKSPMGALTPIRQFSPQLKSIPTRKGLKIMSNLILRDSQDSSKLNTSKGITKGFLATYESIETIINGFVSLVVNVFLFAVTTLTPLAAPIAPAFSVYKALSERLQTPFSIALAGAIAIEITGMFVAKTSIGCHNWNSARNKTDHEAPTKLAITMATIFFTVIFVLSLTIELNPNLVIWIYPGFVIVAITVYVCLAISNNLKEWEQKKAQDIELRGLKNSISAEIRTSEKTLKNLIQNLTEIETQLDTRQSEFDTLQAQIDELIARRNELSKSKNELSKSENDTSFGMKSPITDTSIEIANSARQSKIEQRRTRVLQYLERGLNHNEIANELGVSLATVGRDVKNLNGKVVR